MQAGNPPETATPEPQPFDVQVTEELRVAALDVLARHPEVGCLAVSICWKGNLNSANIPHGLWVGRNPRQGVVAEPSMILGSAWQSLKMLDEIMQRATALLEMVQGQIVEKSKELGQLNAELEKTRQAEGGLAPPTG